MNNVAYFMCSLNVVFMGMADGDLSKSFYFLIANLWLMLGVYLTHNKSNNV